MSNITIKELTPEEVQHYKEERFSYFWSLPLAFCFLFAIFSFISGDWSFFWEFCIGTWVVFIMIYLIASPWETEPERIVFRRTGRVSNTKKEKEGLRVRTRRIKIELEHDILPEGYPEIHEFKVYDDFGGLPYMKQDSSIRHKHTELVGKTVEIAYFARSGNVIEFTVLD